MMKRFILNQKIKKARRHLNSLNQEHSIFQEVSSHLAASEKKLLRALHENKASHLKPHWDFSEEEGGDIMSALIMARLRHPEKELHDLCKKHKHLEHALKIFDHFELPSLIDKDHYHGILEYLEEDNGIVLDNGTIIGLGKYNGLDPEWALTMIHNIYTKLFGVHRFQEQRQTSPVSLTPANHGDQLRIAIIGDWGAGDYKLGEKVSPAVEIVKQIERMNPPVDYLIHLGDIYYCGTSSKHCSFDSILPEHAVKDNFLANLPKKGPTAEKGRCFTMNSNHEMYPGAGGLYEALRDPRFALQNNSTYLALSFGNWTIVILDSAYFDKSKMYMNGSIGDPGSFQWEFVKGLNLDPEKTILFTHHNPLDSKGDFVANKTSSCGSLWNEIKKCFPAMPAYWYFGHLHNAFVYQPVENVKCRCIGNSSLPYGTASNAQNKKNKFEYFANTPFDGGDRLMNQFGVITLGKNTIKEEIFNQGEETPVWSKR